MGRTSWGEILWGEQIRAPGGLGRRVCFSSENTRREVSVRRRMMGICFKRRPFLRTPAIDGRLRAIRNIGKSAGRLYWHGWYRGTTARGTRGIGEYRWK